MTSSLWSTDHLFRSCCGGDQSWVMMIMNFNHLLLLLYCYYYYYSRGSLNSTKSNQKNLTKSPDFWQKVRIFWQYSGFLTKSPDIISGLFVRNPDYMSEIRTYSPEKNNSPTGLFYMVTLKCNNFFSRMNIEILLHTFCLGTYSLQDVWSRISK